jgi:hypothetical protein
VLRDKTRKPGNAPISEEKKHEICRTVRREKLRDETHWSTRRLGKRVGVGHNAVNRILRERGIKPHLAETFQFSKNPDFERKLKDAAGLYMNPPENAVILCVNEKTQLQALERTQPILPILPGAPERLCEAWNDDAFCGAGCAQRECHRGMQSGAQRKRRITRCF